MRVSAACALLLVLGTAANLSAQAATLKTRTKEYEDLRISQDDIRGVEARQGAGKLTFGIADIVSIDYKQAPEAWKKGMSAFRDGDYAESAERFAEAVGTPGSYTWLPGYAAFYLAESLSRIGDSQGALDAYTKVISLDPKPRFVPDCYLALVDLHLRKGAAGAADAKKMVDGLTKLVSGNKALTERYGVLAELATARIELRGGGEAPKALTQLETLLAKAGEQKDVVNRVRLEIGNAHIAMKNFDRAETAFNMIVKDGSSSGLDVLAGAWNGLGDALFAQEKYSDAGLTYSRTYVFCLNESYLRERTAHALYFGGRSFSFQAGKEADAAAKDILIRRSKRLMSKAAKDFQGTIGGERAAKDLGLR